MESNLILFLIIVGMIQICVIIGYLIDRAKQRSENFDSDVSIYNDEEIEYEYMNNV